MNHIRFVLVSFFLPFLLFSCGKSNEFPEEFIEAQVVVLQHIDNPPAPTTHAWSDLYLIIDGNAWDPGSSSVKRDGYFYRIDFTFASTGAHPYDGTYDFALSNIEPTEEAPVVSCWANHLTRWVPGSIKISGSTIDAYVRLEDQNKMIHIHFDREWTILESGSFVY